MVSSAVVHALSERKPVTSTTQTVLTWLAGVSGVALTIVFSVWLNSTVNNKSQKRQLDDDQNKAIAENARKFQTFNEIYAKDNTVLNDKLDAIANNTADRITKAETMREIQALKEDIHRTDEKVEAANTSLTDRLTFMTDTTNDIAENRRNIEAILKTLEE